MNYFDFFEEIYCINLDHRTDRWKHAQKEFKKVGILNRVKRFSAIKEDDGRLGVIKSNLAIIKTAKSKGLNNVLVFEDDVKFILDNPQKYLKRAISQIGKLDWYVFYLGANTIEKLIKIKRNLILIKNGYSAHSLAYSKKVYDKIIEKYEGIKIVSKHIDILDVFLAEQIQNKYPCLMVNPMLTTQMSDYSDIDNKLVDQSYIKERFEKNIQEVNIFKKLFQNIKEFGIQYYYLLVKKTNILNLPFPKNLGKWLKKRGIRIDISNNRRN